MIARRSFLYGLLLLVVVVPHHYALGMRLDDVNIRGNDDIELNCPSLPGEPFPPGTIRCEGCNAIITRMEVLLVKRRIDVVDVEPATVCEWMFQWAELKQRKNGYRFWDVPQTEEEGNARKKEGDEDDSGTSTKSRLTYHTKAERERLPCAPYLLRRMCERWMEDHEDEIESCLGTFTRNVKKNKSIAAANDTLHGCLGAICKKRECEPKKLDAKKEEERVSFLKYEGAFGPKNFKYVADVDDENKLMRNPYARGGDLAAQNEYLQDEDSDL